jgi:hypothetical protein
MGADGWEISAHAASAPDHEPIQGKQYSDADYQALNNSLVRRIGTLNCGHAAFPIVLGVSQPQYTPEELEQMRRDNETGVTVDGVHYTTYQATQMQRKLERTIRKQKQRILVDEATEDKDKLLTDQIKYRRLEQEYTRFSDAAGLRTQQERAEVTGFGPVQAARAVKDTEANHAEWLKSIGAQDTELNTLAKYYEGKYNNSPEYALLKQYAKDVETGWISPLSGFENYKSLYQRIQTEIVGKTAADGTVITGQVPHFMQRVIGTSADPEKLKNDLRIIRRSGVEIDDIKDALFNPEKKGRILVRKTGQRSVKMVGKNCAVAFNPDTGMLIQTNPRKKES